MQKRPVIIDCDTGTDDAIAILAALGDDTLDVRAITTVCGNVDLCYTAQNTLNLVTHVGHSVPVAKGAERPLHRDLETLRSMEAPPEGEILTHGQTGMGTVGLPQSGAAFAPQTAVELIYEQAVICQGELEIIAIGPQTNLAIALERHPDLAGLIKHLYFMGGAIQGGNSTAVAEFNIFFDPEAAAIVLGAGIEMTMVGLDVTTRATVSAEQTKQIRAVGTPAAAVTADLLEFMAERRDAFGGEDTLMHDALAVAALCVPQALETKRYFVDVECQGKYTYGHTYVQTRPRLTQNPPNCNVAVDLDLDKFTDWLYASIANC